MAIEFHCPHCQHGYRLKDEFAGKRATCKNPNCRQVIVIPKPVTVPQDQALPSAAELEAAALSALADERPVEETAAEQVIPMTCTFCDHKWNEPFARAGKNTLCPNPECRQRLRIPEPKADQPLDWRQSRTRLPSGAKQNFEKLANVEDAAEAKYVSGTALREAGATGIEIEPRTLREKAIIGLAVCGVLAGICVGIALLMRTSKVGDEDRLVEDARKLFAESSGELGSPESNLCTALFETTTGEYHLRKNTPAKFKEAHGRFCAARDELRNLPVGAERNALGAELILAMTEQGGTTEQAKAQTRFRWQPEITSGSLKINDRPHTIHEELRQWLTLLNSGDFDFRVGVARRLTRELSKKGQTELVADLIPMELFRDESERGKALIALELYRLDPGSDLARRMTEELKAQYAASKGSPPPSLVQIAIATVLKEKVASMGLDANRVVLGVTLLEGKSDEALKLVETQTRSLPDRKLEALLVCTDWMATPGPAFEQALKLIESQKGKKEATLSQSQIVRLSENAAASGSLEMAIKLASNLTDEGLKAWATGNAVRLFLAGNPNEKVDQAVLALPDDPHQLKVGHAWGVYWIARRNAVISGDSSAQKKAISGWAKPLQPFGLTGLALGLQDR